MFLGISLGFKDYSARRRGEREVTLMMVSFRTTDPDDDDDTMNFIG